MYSDFYDASTVTAASSDQTWIIISLVLAVVGGIVTYMFFVSKEKKAEYSELVTWAHDFLNFKVFFIDAILKILYMITAIYITLASFTLINESAASFFLSLIGGNLLARIAYEMLLLLLTVVKNTTEINNKLSYREKKEPLKVAPKPKKKPEPKKNPEEKQYAISVLW